MRRVVSHRTLLLVIAALALTAIALALADDTTRSPVVRQAEGPLAAFTVSERDFSRWRPGSPERALIGWVEAVQANRVREVIARTDATAVAGLLPSRLAQAVRAASPVVGVPEVVRSLGTPSLTRVRAAVPRRGDSSELPSGQLTTFLVKRKSGDWVIADLSFLMAFLHA